MTFVGKTSLRTKIAINSHRIDQVNAYIFGCNLSYINPQETQNKLARFQQLLTTINTLFRKLRQDTILKFKKQWQCQLCFMNQKLGFYDHQLRRTDATKTKLLRPLAGYTFYDQESNEDIFQ